MDRRLIEVLDILPGNREAVAISYLTTTCAFTSETFQGYLERLQREVEARIEYFGYTDDDRRLAVLIAKSPTAKSQLLEYLWTSYGYVALPPSECLAA